MRHVVSVLYAILCGTVFLCVTMGTSWAQVNEARVSQTLYVNNQASQASDNNPGTEALPFKTISAAAEKAINNQWDNIGTKVLIAAGTYREHIDLSDYGPVDKEVPVILEAQTPGSVIISGSDIWTGWQPQDGSSVYTHAWPYDWGRASIPPGWPDMADIVRRQEMIFVDGQALAQVLSRQDLEAGTFYISEASGDVSLWPPAGMSMNGARVEVATRSHVFEANGKKTLCSEALFFSTPIPLFRLARCALSILRIL